MKKQNQMKEKKKNNKIKYKSVIYLMIIIIIIFSFFSYKKIKQGNNNTIKKYKDVDEYILDISSYKAVLNIKIKSNKNENDYKMEQTYIAPNIYKQIVMEPENLKGIISKYDGTTLSVENTRLNLKNIYDSYKCINDNDLYLSTFIKEYKQSENIIIDENKNEKIIEIKINNKIKKLYINKNDYKPLKLVIEDENEEMAIYIEYNEIEINENYENN